MKYRNIGKNRVEIMGLSIIMIMLFHCGVLKFGDIGVDFFLFISGFSMYHSLSKNSDTWDFLVRRAKRILPMYLIVSVPYFINNSSSISQFFLRITNVAVLTEGYLNGWWFIGAICFCYSLSPMIYSVMKRTEKCKYLVTTIMFCVCYICGFLFENSSIVMFRMTNFFLGFIVADNISKNCNDNDRLKLAFVVLGAFLLILCTNSISENIQYKYMFYSFVAFPLIHLMANFFQCVSGNLKRIFHFMGTITLELYLLHEYFAIPMARELLCCYSGGAKTILSMIIAIVMAMCLNWIVNHFLSFLIKSIIQKYKRVI